MSWSLTAELEGRTHALEMRCYRRLLNISNKDSVTNEEVYNKIQDAIGNHDNLLSIVKLIVTGTVTSQEPQEPVAWPRQVKGTRRNRRQIKKKGGKTI